MKYFRRTSAGAAVSGLKAACPVIDLVPDLSGVSNCLSPTLFEKTKQNKEQITFRLAWNKLIFFLEEKLSLKLKLF